MNANLGVWLTIVACGVVTYATRLSFIALHERIAVPDWFREALTFVPVAVLSAIILPEILVPNDTLNLSLLNPRLLAGIVATIVAWRTKNVWVTIAVGMVALWGLMYVLK